MSIVLNESNDIICKTNPLDSKIDIGDYSIDSGDFCFLIQYFLTNTDLIENDERLVLVEKIKEYKLVDGYNINNKRIKMSSKECQFG